MNITYLPGVKADINQILSIEVDAFPNNDNGHEFFLQYIKANSLYIAKDKLKIVGYIAFDEKSDKFISIDSVAVHHAYRRKGIGTQLVKFVVELCSDIKTHVRETNLEAQLFFKSLGFMVFDVIRGAYDTTTEDCYVFTLYAGVSI